MGGYSRREPERSSFGGIVLMIGVAVLILTMFFIVIPEGLKRSERIECLKWQGWAQEYQDFYLTPSQADQCKAHNIIINAPVKF